MIQFDREEPGLPGSVTLDGRAGDPRFVWESETNAWHMGRDMSCSGLVAGQGRREY
jgi:hypothetical protein